MADNGNDIDERKEGRESFPHLLYNLLEKDLHDILRWNSENSFVIVNLKKLSEEVLSHHFKHSNFSSFARLLNAYGFKRTRNKNFCEYKHPVFIRGRPELLVHMSRKTAGFFKAYSMVAGDVPTGQASLVAEAASAQAAASSSRTPSHPLIQAAATAANALQTNPQDAPAAAAAAAALRAPATQAALLAVQQAGAPHPAPGPSNQAAPFNNGPGPGPTGLMPAHFSLGYPGAVPMGSLPFQMAPQGMFAGPFGPTPGLVSMGGLPLSFLHHQGANGFHMTATNPTMSAGNNGAPNGAMQGPAPSTSGVPSVGLSAGMALPTLSDFMAMNGGPLPALSNGGLSVQLVPGSSELQLQQMSGGGLALGGPTASGLGPQGSGGAQGSQQQTLSGLGSLQGAGGLTPMLHPSGQMVYIVNGGRNGPTLSQPGSLGMFNMGPAPLGMPLQMQSGLPPPLVPGPQPAGEPRPVMATPPVQPQPPPPAQIVTGSPVKTED